MGWKKTMKKRSANNLDFNVEEQTVFHDPKSLLTHFKNNESQETILSYDYYLSILEQSWLKAQEDKVEEAIDDLVEEMNAPYIPTKANDYFAIMIKLLRNYAYEKRNEQIKKLKASDLIKLALDDFPKNLSLFDYLTTKPSGFFSVNDLDYFRFIFTSNEIKNELKFNALSLLSEIVDFHEQKIKFINHNLNQEQEITISSALLNREIQEYYDLVYQEINDLLFQDPSLEELASSVIDQIVHYYWPFMPNDFDAKELAKGTVQYIYQSLNNDKHQIDKNDPIIKMISLVLK